LTAQTREEIMLAISRLAAVGPPLPVRAGGLVTGLGLR
jgi:hypothetical protein